ncbi:MAG: DJ-1/PfpI family protein [Planctomycetes bacterium]|nr:DJ-1/PfpI family protein [Planctomycetota bacterium]MCB9903079.1 DJ-1/PfpI family protein [Planctomycetota bacterium]
MTSSHHVLVPLAAGFEETEAVALIDVLRRADLRVSVVALGARRVEGSHGIVLEADASWDEADLASVTAVALPGGMPGTRKLAADERLLDLIRRLDAESRLVAAVCAAPLVLAAAGVLRAPATSHPGVMGELALDGYREDRVVRNGAQITSRGPGTALEWALALVAELVSPERAAELGRAMLVRG